MIHFFTGEDTLAAHQALEHEVRSFIGDAYDDPFSRIVILCDDNSSDESALNNILKNFTSQSMFAEKKAIVVRNANKLSPSEQTELAKSLKLLDEETWLFLEAPKLDGRQELAKTLKKVSKVHKFEKPKDYQIPDWIIQNAPKHGFQVAKDVAIHFQELAGNDPQVLNAEFIKMRAFDPEANRIGIELLTEVVSSNGDGNIFELQMFFGLRTAPKFTIALNKLLDSEEHPILITTMLYGHVAKLFRIQYRLSLRQTPDAIAKEFNIHPFLFKKNQMVLQAQKATPERLRRVLIRLAEIEAGLKLGQFSKKAEFQLALLAMV